MSNDLILAKLDSLTALLSELRLDQARMAVREGQDEGAHQLSDWWLMRLVGAGAFWLVGGPVLAVLVLAAARGRGPVSKVLSMMLALLLAPHLAGGIILAALLEAASGADDALNMRRGRQSWGQFLLCCCRADPTPAPPGGMEMSSTTPTPAAGSVSWWWGLLG